MEKRGSDPRSGEEKVLIRAINDDGIQRSLEGVNFSSFEIQDRKLE
jgi:hypothetical protein